METDPTLSLPRSRLVDQSSEPVYQRRASPPLVLIDGHLRKVVYCNFTLAHPGRKPSVLTAPRCQPSADMSATLDRICADAEMRKQQSPVLVSNSALVECHGRTYMCHIYSRMHGTAQHAAPHAAWPSSIARLHVTPVSSPDRAGRCWQAASTCVHTPPGSSLDWPQCVGRAGIVHQAA